MHRDDAKHSGREVKLAIKPNSHTIRKGEKKVIKGEGFYGQGTNERGDMVIYFRVMNPVETYLMQGTGWRMKWAKRVAVAVGIWIALNLAGERLFLGFGGSAAEETAEEASAGEETDLALLIIVKREDG